MSLYHEADERAIRVQRLVDDWTASGLLMAEQRIRVVPDLKVDLRRTNRFLRITLFLFGFMIVQSIAGLFVVALGPGDDAVIWLALGAAVAFFAIAQMMVTRYRLYHFGVEESAVIASLVFFVIGSAMALQSTFSILQALIAGTIGSVVVFRRFGYVYAGVSAVLLAGAIPFGLQQANTVQRLFAMVILLTIFFVARERQQDHEWDYPGDAYGTLAAVAWAALYFLTNLQISSWFASPDAVKQFYWGTYAGIWILPVAGLVLAIRDRHRALLDVNIALALVTLMSNKPYLGAESNTWDPILFGAMLIAIVVGVRRWLSNGPGGSRHGFVAHRLLASEKARLATAAAVTVLAPGAPPAHTHDSPGFGGGRSGGAGASENF